MTFKPKPPKTPARGFVVSVRLEDADAKEFREAARRANLPGGTLGRQMIEYCLAELRKEGESGQSE